MTLEGILILSIIISGVKIMILQPADKKDPKATLSAEIKKHNDGKEIAIELTVVNENKNAQSEVKINK